MKSLDNKIFVVTGGGSGIGRELVLQLLQKNAHVAAVDIKQTDLRETSRIAGARNDRLSAHCLDVTDRTAVAALVAAVRARHGGIDGVINNAGITNRPTLVSESNYDDFRKIMEVNFWGVVNMSMAFLPDLMARPESSLVNLSSGGGLLGFMGLREYCASKWAVRGYTESLRGDLAGSSLCVSCVHPGKVLTNLARHTIDLNEEEREAAYKRLTETPGGITPSTAAAGIIAGIQAKKQRILLGKDVFVMDIIGRLFPTLYTKMLHKQMSDLVESARPPTHSAM
jgi:NAD(P)-dependent dehydrogenase (short-subunit alcohol dehydrogenase family)